MVRGFFNVCRHHAAAVVTEPEGAASVLRCPYHGWTYALDGQLKGTPDFAGVCDFDRSANGLVPVETAAWEKWIFVRLERDGPSLERFPGSELSTRIESLGLGTLRWMERRHYTLDCNWKVFVDNYLDGGYHVPHLHKGLDSVLDYSTYTIENGERFCLQSSPIVSDGAEARTGAVRTGDRAFYYWIYPNFMINCYGGAMDTNLVIPRAIDRTDVIFDFYFSDVSEQARARNRASIEVSEQIQDEDVAICTSVQRGLRSGRTRRAGCRCAAKRGSTCSIGCCTTISRPGLSRTKQEVAQDFSPAREPCDESRLHAHVRSTRAVAARARCRLRSGRDDRQHDWRRDLSRSRGSGPSICRTPGSSSPPGPPAASTPCSAPSRSRSLGR